MITFTHYTFWYNSIVAILPLHFTFYLLLLSFLYFVFLFIFYSIIYSSIFYFCVILLFLYLQFFYSKFSVIIYYLFSSYIHWFTIPFYSFHLMVISHLYIIPLFICCYCTCFIILCWYYFYSFDLPLHYYLPTCVLPLLLILFIIIPIVVLLPIVVLPLFYLLHCRVVGWYIVFTVVVHLLIRLTSSSSPPHCLPIIYSLYIIVADCPLPYPMPICQPFAHVQPPAPSFTLGVYLLLLYYSRISVTLYLPMLSCWRGRWPVMMSNDEKKKRMTKKKKKEEWGGRGGGEACLLPTCSNGILLLLWRNDVVMLKKKQENKGRWHAKWRYDDKATYVCMLFKLYKQQL